MPMNPVKLFISYAHKDMAYLKEFEISLKNMQRQNLIDLWTDQQLIASMDWDSGIKSAMHEAEVVVFLVSPDFIASDYIYDVELKKTMEKNERKEQLIVPIIIRPCDFSGTTLSKFQALPSGAKPISKWEDRDDAWLDVTNGLKQLIQRIRSTNVDNAVIDHAGPVSNETPVLQPGLSINNDGDLIRHEATSPSNSGNRNQQWKIQIAKGKVEKVIDELLTLPDLDSDDSNNIILLSGRFQSAKKNQRMGLVSERDVTITFNQIKAALLEIIDDL